MLKCSANPPRNMSSLRKIFVFKDEQQHEVNTFLPPKYCTSFLHEADSSNRGLNPVLLKAWNWTGGMMRYNFKNSFTLFTEDATESSSKADDISSNDKMDSDESKENPEG